MAKKKKKIELSSGIIHIHTTFNNTIISVTDEKGDVKI
jgi:small subunit ribosomal protein S11